MPNSFDFNSFVSAGSRKLYQLFDAIGIFSLRLICYAVKSIKGQREFLPFAVKRRPEILLLMLWMRFHF